MKKNILGAFIIFISASNAIAQQAGLITLKGVVKTNEGKPGIGVTAQLTKSSRRAFSTICDADGSFYMEGIKQNDTVYFTCVGLKPACFVVDKIYNYINITLQADTFKTICDNPKYKLRYNYYNPNLLKPNYGFTETNEPVSQKPLSEYKSGDRIFVKVEISPEIISNTFKLFYDTLSFAIKEIEKKYKKNISSVVKIFYVIHKDGVTTADVISSCNEKINDIIKSSFESTIRGRAAMQNGRNINTVCSVEFQISIKKKGADVTFDNLQN